MNVFHEKGLTSCPSGSLFRLIYLGLFDEGEFKGGGRGLMWSPRLMSCSGLEAGLTPFPASAAQEPEEKAGMSEHREFIHKKPY